MPPTLAAADRCSRRNRRRAKACRCSRSRTPRRCRSRRRACRNPSRRAEIIAVANRRRSSQTAPTRPTTPWTTVAHPSVDPRDAIEAIPASAPPPPADSTAALVWRAPTIERLPEKTPQTSDYVSIPAGSLGAYRGARVRLLTAGGKLVEGRVQRARRRRCRHAGPARRRQRRDAHSAAGIRDAKVRRSVIR